MSRPKLKPETARRLARSLERIDGAKTELTLACQGGEAKPHADALVVDAADRYLDARDEMGETMREVAAELEGGS